MKKYLLGLFFIFAVTFSFAGTKDSTTVASQVIASAPNATAVFIAEKLEKLAESLKVPVEHMFKVLVRREVISSISLVISITILIILSVWILKFTFNDLKKTNAQWRADNPGNSETYNYYEVNEGWWIIGYILGVALLIGSVFTFARCLGDVINGIVNPEYGAYMQILELLK